MAKARLSMRKIKETLRLSYQCGLSRRQVARSVKASRSTVADYLYRAERAGIGWPLPEDLTDQELEQRLFLPQATPVLSAKPLPDFDYIYQELKAHKKFNGKVSITDGPYAETKEQIGGILLLDANELNQATELMSKHPGIRVAVFEVRPLDEETTASVNTGENLRTSHGRPTSFNKSR